MNDMDLFGGYALGQKNILDIVGGGDNRIPQEKAVAQTVKWRGATSCVRAMSGADTCEGRTEQGGKSGIERRMGVEYVGFPLLEDLENGKNGMRIGRAIGAVSNREDGNVKRPESGNQTTVFGNNDFRRKEGAVSFGQKAA